LGGSFIADWYYGDSAHSDLMRVCLGSQDTGLAMMWINSLSADHGPWKTSRMNVGAPLYTVLADTFANDATASARTTFILGDPTLCEYYVAPVSSLTATNSGSNVLLSWPSQSAATSGFHVYHASSPTGTAWAWLTDVSSGSTSWTHTAPGSGTHAYLIKSMAIKVTGSGSFTNLSLGAFSNGVTVP
jgi:hypothetical protein